MEKKSILLVEDEALIAMAERKALEKLGYCVASVRSGEAAVAAFEGAPGHDLVLMDIDLGRGIDGTEAAERILGIREVPIVFLSSHAEPEVVAKTEKVTSYGYIVKHSSITVIDASIKMAFKLFEARRRLRESEESLAITLHSIGDAVIATDIEGSVTRMNRTAEIMTGWSFRDAERRPLASVFNIVDAATGKAAEDPVRKVLRSGKIVGIGNHTALIARTGEEFQITDSAAPIKDGQGRIQGVILVFSDVTEKYAAETRLRESERMLLESQSLAGIGSIVLDLGKAGAEPEAWRASPQIYSIFGLGQSYPRTREHWELLAHPDSREGLEAGLRRAVRERTRLEHEYRIVRADDGAERWVQIRAEIECDEKDSPSRLVGTVQDITDRKRTDDALRLSERRLSVVFDNNHDMQLLLAVEPGGVFRTVAVNQHYLDAARALGLDYSVEKLVGRTIDEALRDLGIGGELFETTMGRYRRAAAEGLPVRFEEELELPGGHYYAEVSIIPVLDSGGACTFLLYTSHDITDRKRVEAELRAAEARYRNLADMSQDLIFQCDGEGRYRYLNPAWEQTLGYRPEEMLGRRFSDFQKPEEASRSLEEFGRLMEGNSVKGFEATHLAKDGREVNLVFSARAVLDGRGRAAGTIGTAYDVTERKRAEREIGALLEEKETILKEVHHRIKNNMQSMKGLLVLQAGAGKSAEAAAALRDAAERMSSMELLYERLYLAPKVSELSLGEYLPSLIDGIAANFPSKAPVEVEKRIQDIVLDAKRLQPVGMIVNELLTNALKHAFEGRRGNRISVSAVQDLGRVSIVVEDNGVGIGDSVGAGASTGFGLMLVASLAQQLRGEIRIERDAGTRIVLGFPL